MRRQIAVLLIGLFVVPQLVSGQTIAPGTRVRVSHPGEGTRTGTLVALTADTLEVRLGGAESVHLPVAQVTRLDVSLGKQRHLLRGAGVGFLVGGGLGALAGGAAGSSCAPHEWLCPGTGGGAVIGGVFFGSIGGVLVLIAGVIPTEKWERVGLQERRISLVAPSGSHGRGVGLRLAF